MERKKNNESKTYTAERMSIGMCIRVGIGVMIGIFRDNIPLCICFGISIGMGIGSLIKK